MIACWYQKSQNAVYDIVQCAPFFAMYMHMDKWAILDWVASALTWAHVKTP